MSVINNVLKDLETRESRFTPIEITSVDADNNPVTVMVTISQAIKKWQERQDPTLDATFEQMRWSQEFENKLFSLLGPEEMAWAPVMTGETLT